MIIHDWYIARLVLCKPVVDISNHADQSLIYSVMTLFIGHTWLVRRGWAVGAYAKNQIIGLNKGCASVNLSTGRKSVSSFWNWSLHSVIRRVTSGTGLKGIPTRPKNGFNFMWPETKLMPHFKWSRSGITGMTSDTVQWWHLLGKIGLFHGDPSSSRW